VLLSGPINTFFLSRSEEDFWWFFGFFLLVDGRRRSSDPFDVTLLLPFGYGLGVTCLFFPPWLFPMREVFFALQMVFLFGLRIWASRPAQS